MPALRPSAPSVAAALALHGMLAWAVLSLGRAPITPPPAPMQVRLTTLEAERRQSAPKAQAERPPMPAPAPAVSPTPRVPAQPLAPKADVPPPPPKATPPSPVPPPAAVAPPTAQVPAPVAGPTPSPVPVPSTTATVPSTHQSVPASTASPAPTAVATPAAAQAAIPAGDKPGSGGQDPVELASSAVAYLVQPVLTFPDGDDQGEYGTVTLRVLIDEKGRAIEVRTLKSSGYPRLDQHGARVIRRAQFKPQVINGEARKAWASVNLHFNAPKP